MKRFLTLLPALLIAACASVPATPPPAGAPALAGPGRFKILQINDVYKIEGLEGGQTGGLARVRSLREHLESDGTPVLVLHGGDALFPSVMSKYLEAKPIVDIMNMLDGDPAAADPHFFVTFGNHEFDKSDARILVERMRESGFQWLGANTRWCNPECDQRFPGQQDRAIVELDGMRIGLFGIIYPLKKTWVEATDPVAAAHQQVAALRAEGAQVVIALTHQDMGDDAGLLRAVPGIDLIIGGHDHLYAQQQVDGRWVTKADADAKSAIVYDVTVPRDGAIRTAPLRIALDATVPRDPQIDQAVDGWLAILNAALGGNQNLGQTRNLLEGVEPAVRGRETALGNLLADAAREQMQTDIAILNGGGIRINDNIPPGPITKYDMEGVFYYKNNLVAFRATGEQVLELLRNAVSRADAGDGRFLQVSGLSFVYRPSATGFTVDPRDVRVGGNLLDPAATYTVATSDFLYLHGIEDGYTLFTDPRRPPKVNVEREADFRSTVEAWIRARGTVDSAIEGRIVRGE